MNRASQSADVELSSELTAILSDLIAMPSAQPDGTMTAIAAYTAERLRKAGYSTEIAREVGVENVVARLGSGSPCVVFNAHMDTVGFGDRGNWKHDPFVAHIEDGLVFGLGAGNCKGSMSVQLWLAEEIARRGGPAHGEVVFTFVGDEENLGPHGMRFLRESGRVKPDMLILGAQTECQLVTAERGVLWTRVTTRGKAAHAGRPFAGDNAILRMIRIINRLEAELGPAVAARQSGVMRASMNIGKLAGGENTNVVPDHCVMEIDRRVLIEEGVDAAFDEIERVVGSCGEPAGTVSVERLRGTNGFRAPTETPLVQAFMAEILGRLGKPAELRIANGASDGRYFADDGISILNFGPGSGAQAHATNESVPVNQMVDAAHIQLGAVARLLGVRPNS